MKLKTRAYRNTVAVIGVALLGLGITGAKAASLLTDSLYIGDGNDNTIKRFDASTGKYLGVFVTNNGCPANPPSSPPLGCLYGPRGLVFDGPPPSGHLLVVDQNVSPPLPPPAPQAGKPPALIFPGAIYEYSAQTGTFMRPLVPPDTKLNAPPEPRGIALYNDELFVASLGLGGDNTAPCVSNAPSGTGCVQAFDAGNGKFLGFLPPSNELAASFHPRGVVIGPGPDGPLLYVSNDPVLGGNGGQILRYDPKTGSFKDIFVDNDTCIAPSPLTSCDFNRPEGLVFGPDGNLYVTSFISRDMPDTDKILVFAGPGKSNQGALIGQIVLDQVGDFRAAPQALLFGPGDKLFVPITNAFPGSGPYSGQVRLYDMSKVSTNATLTPFSLFVPSSSQQNSPLGFPWYLTFGNTDPATLNYVPR